MIADPPTRALSRIRAGEPITRQVFAALWRAGYFTGTDRDHDRIVALFDAGWTPEDTVVFIDGDLYSWPASWPWRRPPRRPGRPGRRFSTTGRAYNAMMREKGDHR